MVTADPNPIFAPHLDRWASLGLLASWERTVSDGGQRRWKLRWHDGRVTIWPEQQLRGAIIAVAEVEAFMAPHLPELERMHRT